MIRTSCLCLDPELIFVTNSNQEFIFTIYPDGAGGIEKEFQQLMEYLLTKVDHKDTKAVRAAYSIYEQSLKEGYSIMDLRSAIMESKEKDAAAQQESTAPVVETVTRTASPYHTESKTMPDTQRVTRQKPEYIRRETREESGPRKAKEKTKGKEQAKVEQKNGWWERFRQKLIDWGLLEPEPERKKETEIRPVYPEEEYLEPEPVIHPTICLSSYVGNVRGILLYQGSDQLEDIRVEGSSLRIGYGKDADIRIDRDTVSNLHARIDREGDTYYIEDLNSTNGTFVNDEPLAYKERRKLESNDSIRFADIRYRFV